MGLATIVIRHLTNLEMPNKAMTKDLSVAAVITSWAKFEAEKSGKPWQVEMILGKGEKVTQKATLHFWFANVIACLDFLAVFLAKFHEWKPPTKNLWYPTLSSKNWKLLKFSKSNKIQTKSHQKWVGSVSKITYSRCWCLESSSL